jgi:hypothetical protein
LVNPSVRPGITVPHPMMPYLVSDNIPVAEAAFLNVRPFTTTVCKSPALTPLGNALTTSSPNLICCPQGFYLSFIAPLRPITTPIFFQAKVFLKMLVLSQPTLILAWMWQVSTVSWNIRYVVKVTFSCWGF